MIDISVIVPVYNGSEHVGAAIGSALAQTPRPVDVVAVNDGSTDRTADVLASFGDRIRVETQANAGVSVARNNGARVARGEWLLFLDADDELLPGALAALARAANSEVGVIFGQVVEMHGDQMSVRGNTGCAGGPPQGAIGNFWKAAIIAPGSALVRRSLHEKVGGFLFPQPVEDRHYWMCCGMFAPFVAVEQPVLHKRSVPHSGSANRLKNIVHGIEAQFHFLDWCRQRGLDTAVFEVSDAALVERALLKARKCDCWPAFREVLRIAKRRRIDSSEIRRLRHWAPVLPLRDAMGRGWVRLRGATP